MSCCSCGCRAHVVLCVGARAVFVLVSAFDAHGGKGIVLGFPRPFDGNCFCVTRRCCHGNFSSLLNPFWGLSSNYHLTTVTHNRLHANLCAIFLSLSIYLEEVMTKYAITLVVRARYHGSVLGFTKIQILVRDSRGVSCNPKQIQIVDTPILAHDPIYGPKAHSRFNTPFQHGASLLCWFCLVYKRNKSYENYCFFTHSPVFLFPVCVHLVLNCVLNLKLY